MRYFDFHTHAFADSIAERAVSALSDTSSIAPATDGTFRGLREKLSECGIDSAMILPVATKPTQQTTINNWAAEIMGGGIYCCGTVHPDSVDAVAEVGRIKALGLCGVKFHSEYQFFRPDEERMFPIPQSFAHVCETFPKMTVVAAHLGGMNLWDDVLRHIAGKYDNLYMDVGVVARYIEDDILLKIIRQQGVEKVLFGSDCPWDDPANEIAMINRLPLSNEEKELIFHKNAEWLLGIERG